MICDRCKKELGDRLFSAVGVNICPECNTETGGTVSISLAIEKIQKDIGVYSKAAPLKTITLDQFMYFQPCYDKARIQEIAGNKKDWNALDILALNIPAKDRFWSVLREEFIDAPILHEFACQCAEEAFKAIDEPDPRSVNAVKTKRKWLKGAASDSELGEAASEAWCIVGTANDANADESDAAVYAAATTWTGPRDTAWDAARVATDQGKSANAQIALLVRLLSS